MLFVWLALLTQSWDLRPLAAERGLIAYQAAKNTTDNSIPASSQATEPEECVFLFYHRSSDLHYFWEKKSARLRICRIEDSELRFRPGDRVMASVGKPLASNRSIAVIPIPELIEHGTRPEPRPVSLRDISAGEAYNQWVGVEAFVTKIYLHQQLNLLEVTLLADKPLTVFLETEQIRSLGEWEKLYLHRNLGIVGCALPWKAIVAKAESSIRVASERDLQVLSSNFFEIDSVPVGSLSEADHLDRVVKVEGTIVETNADGVGIGVGKDHLFLPIGEQPLGIGEFVEVIGVPASRNGKFEFSAVAFQAYELEAGSEPGRESRKHRIYLRSVELQSEVKAVLDAGQPVRISGIVNALPPGRDGFYAQDATGGFFVHLAHAPLPKIGEQVVVVGVTAQRRGIPFIRADSLAATGENRTPPLHALASSEWTSSNLEGRLISAEAVVRSITPDKNGRGNVWKLTRSDETIFAHVPESDPPGERDPRVWTGSVIQVRGVFSQLPLSDEEPAANRIWVAKAAGDIILLRKPSEVGCDSLAEVQKLSEANRTGQNPLLIRARGEVVGFGDGAVLHLQDATSGLKVVHQDTLDLPLGSLVEVVGLFSPGRSPGDSAYLRDAKVHPLQRESISLVSIYPLASRKSRDLRGCLVRGEGTILEWMNYASPPVLMIVSENRELPLQLPVGIFAGEWREKYAPGTRIGFTGVYQPEIDPASGADRELVLVRSANDLRLQPAANWWTLYHIIGLILAILVAIMAVLLWGYILNQRLREQTSIISQQREREEQLEDQYRELFENANDFMFTLDVDGRITSINRAGENLMGYARGELLGRLLTEFVAPEDKNTVESMVESDEPITYEIVLFNQSMKELCLEISSRPVMDSENVAVHVVGIGRDITRRKLTEIELKRAFRVLKSHIENSPLAIIEWDRGFRVTRWSGQAEAMFGWKDEEVLFHHPSEWRFVHDEDSASVEKVMTALLNKEGRNFCSNRNYTKSGGTLYCEWYNSALVDENGELVSILSLVLDVTQRVEGELQRQQLEENIRQVQKMEAVGRLAGGVAHDFNNLLTIINGNSHILLADRLPRDHRDLVGQIKQAGEKAASLTRQLLAFGRKQIAAPKEIDVNFILNDLKNMLSRLAGESVQFKYDLETPLPPVLIDPTMTEQVIYNLVVNARDAMPTGGRITVRTRSVHNACGVRLEIEDTGTGMDDKTKLKIFEPFFTTKAIGKGTGLGLATVYSVVQQAGGTIEVESSPGMGTLFRIDLPRSVGRPVSDTPFKSPSSFNQEIVVPTRANKPESAMASKETILLVEDEDGLRLLARRVLEMHGYNVVHAIDGRDALEVYRNHECRIDLVITDVMMPEVSGVQLVEQLKLREPDLRVIFMSGYTDDEVIHQGVLMEEVNFLQKPFSPPSLLAKVKQVLAMTEIAV